MASVSKQNGREAPVAGQRPTLKEGPGCQPQKIFINVNQNVYFNKF